MDSQRWNNVGRIRTSYAGHGGRVQGAPLEAFIEISARCNLRCQMCAISFDTRYRGSSGRPAFFQPELFNRLRPIFPTLLRAHLYGLGEPVLNPHLTEYIGELSSAGVETWFTTNATLIEEEKAEAFARAGADRISISIDGATRQTYERIRRGARFDRLLRGLRALSDARRRHGKPRLTVNFVAMRSNLDELPALVDLCAAFGIEEMNVEPLFYWGGESPDLDRQYRAEALDDSRYRVVMERSQLLAEAAGIHFSTRFLTSEGSMDYKQRVVAAREPETWICSEPWATVYVTVAGEVRTCCLNDESFGNLFAATFEEIWNGDAFVSFRDQHLEQAPAPVGCGNCVENGRQRHSPYFEALEPVSYRPLLSLSDPPSGEHDLAIERPAEGEVVTDPLVITGRLPPGSRTLEHRPLLYIDRTLVSDLSGAVIVDGRFLLVLPVPYLSEGAHILSMHVGDPGTPAQPGRSRRTCHFRQSPEGDGEAIAVTRTAAVILTLKEPAQSASVWIDGQPWSPVEWYCCPAPRCREESSRNSLLRRAFKRFDRRSQLAWRAGVALALDGLSPGRHAMEIRPRRQGAHTVLLERFPDSDTASPPAHSATDLAVPRDAGREGTGPTELSGTGLEGIDQSRRGVAQRL